METIKTRETPDSIPDAVTRDTILPKNIENPFVPITMEKILTDLTKSRQQIAEGNVQPMNEAIAELRREFGLF